MWGVVNKGDLSKVKELGCNVAHHPTFDGLPDTDQDAYIAECKRWGLKLCWSAYGGSEFAKQNRDRTVLRWKDDPVVFAWYIISEPANTKMLIADQENKYVWIKELDSSKPVMIDWSLWNHDRDTKPYRTVDVADILMIYSYPYEDGHTPESAYNRYFANLTALNTRNLPVIPLLQCFYYRKYHDPAGTIKENHDKWKAYLEGKGWGDKNIGFYTWSSASYVSDVQRNPGYQAEIRELLGAEPDPDPDPDIGKRLEEIRVSIEELGDRYESAKDKYDSLSSEKEKLLEIVRNLKNDIADIAEEIGKLEELINNL